MREAPYGGADAGDMSNVCGGNLVGAGPENKKKSTGGLMVRYWTLFTIENCRFSHPGWHSPFTLSSTVPPAQPVAGPTVKEQVDGSKKPLQHVSLPAQQSP